MNTFGLFSNVGIILFADAQIVKVYSYDERWVMMFVIENILLILVFFFRINFLPNWFDYAEKAKLGYLTSGFAAGTGSTANESNKNKESDKNKENKEKNSDAN